MRYLFFLFLCFAAKAEVPLDGPSLYQYTKAACLKVSNDLHKSHSLEFDRIYAGHFPTQEFTSVINQIRRESFYSTMNSLNVTDRVPTAKLVLSNPYFKKALFECYPDSPQARTFFANAVKRADLSGKAYGAASFIAVSKGVSIAGGKIIRWGQKAFSVFNSFSKYATLAGLPIYLTSDQRKAIEKMDANRFLEQIGGGLSNEERLNSISSSLVMLTKMNQNLIDQLTRDLGVENDPIKITSIKSRIERAKINIQELEIEIQKINSKHD